MKTSFRMPAMLMLFDSLSLSACGQPPVVETNEPPTAVSTPTPDPVASIPAEINGEVLYIPFPVSITVDGDLSDWVDLPVISVDRGPMLSTDPAENGTFSFAVAADQDNLYITMQMPDKNIIAGQHGTEFWNEDSMEFYINASDDLNASDYGLKIMQVNINASAIGNTDPEALTVTGVFSTDAHVRGFVFKTSAGSGF